MTEPGFESRQSPFFVASGIGHLVQHLAHSKYLVKAIIFGLIFIIIFQTRGSAYNLFNLLLIFFFAQLCQL